MPCKRPLSHHRLIFGVAPQGFEIQFRPIGFFFQSERLVEIVNTHRTATSYRTAFSHFLAPSAEFGSSQTCTLTKG
jgi:hypothetical protein